MSDDNFLLGLWMMTVELKLRELTGMQLKDCHTVTLGDMRVWFFEEMGTDDAAANIGEIEGFPLLESAQ